MSIVDIAREKALEQGIGLNEEELLQVLQIPVSYTHLTLPTNREV